MQINFLTHTLRFKKTIVLSFIVLALAGGILQFGVAVNYNMTDYLPKDAPSTVAIEVMETEFKGNVDNTRVMINNVSVQEALQYKEELSRIDGVTEISWLDDVVDLMVPLEMLPDDLVENYYLDENALFTLGVEEGKEVATTQAIYDVIGENNALTGDALDTALSQEAAGKETMNAALILIPIILVILFLSTTSWVEPLFLLVAIGVSILINLGTNYFVGEISFISQSVAPILQLAVSLDYAIFLLHSFTHFRETEASPEAAMKQAMKRSFPAITASAATTFFGFMALTFMNFEIGADLGINLVKGILLSFLSVMIFLPAFTLLFYRLIDKTKHKPFLPNKYKVGAFFVKLRIPILILIAIIIVPAFLGQGKTNFIYGMGEAPEASRAGQDAGQIEAVFDRSTPLVLLVPEGDLAREEQLIQALEKLDPVKSVIAYTKIVGTTIPTEYVMESARKEFLSPYYSRIILNTTTKAEGEQAFAFVEEVRAITANYYGENFHTTGESVTLYDMKQIVKKDNTLVNVITVATIALVLLVTFKSLAFPIILLLTIQASVWINLTVPYFTGDPLVYIGYLIISIVQLAATVDYAILFSENYTNYRKKMGAVQAITKTINNHIFSISVPAAILSSVGFILWFTSSDPIISSIGILLGRGTLLAFTLVVILLPALLITCDRIVEKTTWKANFFKGSDSDAHEEI